MMMSFGRVSWDTVQAEAAKIKGKRLQEFHFDFAVRQKYVRQARVKL